MGFEICTSTPPYYSTIIPPHTETVPVLGDGRERSPVHQGCHPQAALATGTSCSMRSMCSVSVDA